MFLFYIQCLLGKPREKEVRQFYSNSSIVIDSFLRVYLKNTGLIMFTAWQTKKVWHALLSLCGSQWWLLPPPPSAVVFFCLEKLSSPFHWWNPIQPAVPSSSTSSLFESSQFSRVGNAILLVCAFIGAAEWTHIDNASDTILILQVLLDAVSETIPWGR